MSQELKHKIIETGKLLWDKGLVFGYNGNISIRQDNHVLITGTGTCLGYLTEKDIVTIDLEGNVIGEGKASSERYMHTSIYKALPNIKCVLHTHTTYTNGFFLNNDSFTPKTFEAKFYLGEVKAIPQTTPSVTDPAPVVDALRINNIVALKNHGVVSVGEELFRTFVLVQELEEQVKMDLVSVHYQHKQISVETTGRSSLQNNDVPSAKKYKLFSQDQIDEIVKVVNADAQMQELGTKTSMNMDLAVCMQETGDIHSFKFRNGKIVEVGKDGNAEFLITASEALWRAVFKAEIDPFVATTQKKMSLRGDFARISKWYAPCSRIFQLWTKVSVE